MTVDNLLSSPWAAVIMAAGAGSRMRSSRAKVLHTVAGRPIIRRVVDAVRAAGIPRIVVVVSPGADDVRAAAGRGVMFAVKISSLGPRTRFERQRDTAAVTSGFSSSTAIILLIRPETLRLIQWTHEQEGADLTLTTSEPYDPSGYARVKRDGKGKIIALVEERDADEEDLSVGEVNVGFYAFRASWLWSHLKKVEPSAVTGELYLTDLVRAAVKERGVVASAPVEPPEARGVNSRAELELAEILARERIREQLLEAGVTLIDSATTYVEEGVTVGRDTVIHPNTTISGQTVIGEDCEIGPNSVIRASEIGPNCQILASVIEDSVIESGVAVGPFVMSVGRLISKAAPTWGITPRSRSHGSAPEHRCITSAISATRRSVAA